MKWKLPNKYVTKQYCEI